MREVPGPIPGAALLRHLLTEVQQSLPLSLRTHEVPGSIPGACSRKFSGFFPGAVEVDYEKSKAEADIETPSWVMRRGFALERTSVINARKYIGMRCVIAFGCLV